MAQDLPVTQPTATSLKITVPGASWATASWFVAKADKFGIDSVDYSGQEWTRAHGWRTNKAATSTAVVATLQK